MYLCLVFAKRDDKNNAAFSDNCCLTVTVNLSGKLRQIIHSRLSVNINANQMLWLRVPFR